MPLSIMRIIFGLFMIYFYATAYWFLKLHYAPGGIFSTGFQPTLFEHAWSLILHAAPGLFDIFFGITILSAGMLAVGFLTPLATITL